MAGKHGAMKVDRKLSHRTAILENTTMEKFNDKHYELLTLNVKRYLLNAPDTISKVEMGKAINMIVEMVERESMRDARDEANGKLTWN
jgi:hypothetical protein